MQRYAAVFIKNVSKEAIKALKSNNFKAIDIPKLIPAFINLKMPDNDFDLLVKQEGVSEK